MTYPVFQTESDFIAGAVLVLIALALVVIILLSMLYYNRQTIYGSYIRTQSLDDLSTSTKKKRNTHDTLTMHLTE
jgi:hypothetical protein